MKLGELNASDVAARCRGDGIRIRVGPFVIRMQTPLSRVSAALRFLYADFPLDEESGFADFHVHVWGPGGIRAVVRRQACFGSDRRVPFTPQARSAALAVLEWGLNWCVYTHAHQYLAIHAATVERDGRALLLPAPTNSGKSTLCAALVHSGWRLLSDEFALVRPRDGELLALPRPISLKNESIPLVSSLFPHARLGPLVKNTVKGTVVHLRPPTDSVLRADEPATPAWILVPRFEPNAPARLTVLSKGRALLTLVDNALNYGVLGRRGFDLLADLVDGARCFELTFGDLKEAIGLIATLDSSAPSIRLPRADSVSRPVVVSTPAPPPRAPAASPFANNLVLAALNDPATVGSLSLPDWDVLVRQARRAGVLGRLTTRLHDHGLAAAVPSRVRPHLDAMVATAAHDARVARWEIDRIRRALAPTGVAVTLLKGAAYLLANLPVARGRRFSDVDILVPWAALDSVETALRTHGWQLAKTDEYDQRYYRQWAHELPPLQHRDRSTVVDVHHTILPRTGRLHPDPSRLLEQSRPVPGSAFRMLCPAHMVLHSAAHLFQDEVYGALGNLVDLDGLLRHFAPAPEFWQELVSEAKHLELQRPLFYALRYGSRLLATPIPTTVMLAANAGRPARPVLATMDALVTRALTPEHPDYGTRAGALARGALYVRAHWLRMPPLLLARHLSRKAVMRARSPADARDR